MSKKIKSESKLPKHLFWDLNIDNLEFTKNSNIIIPRLLFATNFESFEDDILVVEQFYTMKEIVEILESTKERVSNQVCELVSKRYKIPVFYRYRLNAE